MAIIGFKVFRVMRTLEVLFQQLAGYTDSIIIIIYKPLKSHIVT
jgi:hypothetical protein